MPLRVMVNGSARDLDGVEDGAPLAAVLECMALKVDRVAVERNGEIVPRRSWAEVKVGAGDKLEIVHFVGGGADAANPGGGMAKNADVYFARTRYAGCLLKYARLRGPTEPLTSLRLELV